jgi:hypothetical protein
MRLTSVQYNKRKSAILKAAVWHGSQELNSILSDYDYYYDSTNTILYVFEKGD